MILQMFTKNCPNKVTCERSVWQNYKNIPCRVNSDIETTRKSFAKKIVNTSVSAPGLIYLDFELVKGYKKLSTICNCLNIGLKKS